MFFDSYDSRTGYRIGRVTIDNSFHTQSADENFFQYFRNDTLYSMTRTVHPDDLEFFKNSVSSLGEDEVRHCIIRMKNPDNEYRWMIIKMSLNIQMLSRGVRLTDIVVKDAVGLEKSTTGLENIIERFRFLMSVQEAIIFEYSSLTNRFYIYSFDYNASTVFFNEDFDYFRFHVLSENLISEGSRETFESFSESIKAGISRFSFEMETGILSNGDDERLQQFSGFTETDGDGNKIVLGLITDKKSSSDSLSGMNSAYEANLDSLTRLFSKKAVTAYAESRISSGEINSVTVAIIDIDDFKNINDTYGHLFGDDIICTAASVIKKETGTKGTAGRIGGDEFMIVLDNIGSEMELRSILRAIRSNIEMQCAQKTDGLKVTCSMGTACWPDDAESYQQLFRTADKALYIAKAKGKDRYVIYNREKHGVVESDESNAINTSLASVSGTTDKSELTAVIASELITGTKINPEQILSRIIIPFEIDRIRFYHGFELSLRNSVPESDVTADAGYIFSDGYINNFSETGVFVIDNTDILEGRNAEAFSVMKQDGVQAAVHVICREGESVKGMISFELLGHFKKWPQSDIGYLNILAKVIFERYLNGDDTDG